ncbi:MAG: hypothetical protein RLZ12_393, partial [Bacillota bacterium]
MEPFWYKYLNDFFVQFILLLVFNLLIFKFRGRIVSYLFF